MTYGQAADCASAIADTVAPARLTTSTSGLNRIMSRVPKGFLAVARPFAQSVSFDGYWMARKYVIFNLGGATRDEFLAGPDLP